MGIASNIVVSDLISSLKELNILAQNDIHHPTSDTLGTVFDVEGADLAIPIYLFQPWVYGY